MPQIGSSLRSRWSRLLNDSRDLHTTFAFEGVVDEIVYIVGPALVTALATLAHPLAGLSCAAAASLGGTAALVSHKRTEPVVTGRTQKDVGGRLPWRTLARLTTCAFTLGALLGGVEVATVAFADERGAKPLAGLMLTIWATGSLVSGL
jgi:hypothetical protein